MRCTSCVMQHMPQYLAWSNSLRNVIRLACYPGPLWLRKMAVPACPGLPGCAGLVASGKPVLLLSMPGGSEWILILLVVLLFFGGKKIPDLMRGIGKGVREFNDAKEHVKNEIDAGMKEKDNRPVPPRQDVPRQEVVRETQLPE
jgi:sec-independent protein translocase protein TatA